VARAPRGQDAILYADVDLAEVADSHARRLFLQDRRPDLYAAWVGR
jgi:N-carbamoylputrescine amidase